MFSHTLLEQLISHFYAQLMLTGLSSLILQHSGLHGGDPGDAVCMESGETISQWRKVYFLKFGVSRSSHAIFLLMFLDI